MKKIKDGLDKLYKFRIVFMESESVYEFVYEAKDGIEFKYLETLYRDINRMVRSMRCQLLVILPIERLTDDRIPVFITQDFDNCSAFSIEQYFSKFSLDVKKSNGRVRRVVNHV